MVFKINENLFKIDGFYYITDPLRTTQPGRHHLLFDTEDKKCKVILLKEEDLFRSENTKMLNMGVIIASNKHLLNTFYLPLPIFLDDVKEVEIKTFGLGCKISGGKAYYVETHYHKDGFEMVEILNYK